MASGFDASAWDTPQVALFEALGEVVDNVGARNAACLFFRLSVHLGQVLTSPPQTSRTAYPQTLHLANS